MSMNLIPVLNETIFNPIIGSMESSLVEIAEASLDSFLEDGVLKNVPILGTIVSMYRASSRVIEWNLLRHTAAFISSFNNGSITNDELNSYRKKLENDSNRAEKELGRVVLLLNRTIDIDKSKILGAFYRSYVKGGILWEKFCELSEVNERMFVSDYEILDAICRDPIKEGQEITDHMMYRIQRLESLGLVMESKTRLQSEDDRSYLERLNRFISTPLGGTFFGIMRSVTRKENRKYD